MILAVVGTRPEAVKMAPVVRALRRRGQKVRLIAAGQHLRLLDRALADFALKPEVDLRLMKKGQTPESYLRRALPALQKLIAKEKPGLVLAVGDTTTVLAAALACLHEGVPFGHVEAGLRANHPRAPFPEEQFRVLADHLAELCFAPTALARRNLLKEGIAASRIAMTGNPVVDAVLSFKRRIAARPIVAVTLHRRETRGAPLRRVLGAIRKAADRHPELTFVFPMHPNPAVKGPVERLLRHPRIALLPPLPYRDFIALLQRSRLVITDSGGIQEEAPSLGKPVLLVREATERPDSGARLVGFSEKKLLAGVARPPKPPRRNPYGDGKAGERIALAVISYLRSGL